MRPEDNQDFRALYEERRALERERDDRKQELEITQALIANGHGSTRQRDAWERDIQSIRHHIGEINTRLIEIEKHNRPLKKD